MKKRIFSLGLLAMSAVFFVNCSNNDDSSNVDPNAGLYKEVLTDLSNDVITKTYEDLNNKAIALKTAVNALTIGNETALTAVKDAWKAARSPWEQSEGFLYGPVDTGGIDPAMDTWPVDVTAMNDILNSSNPITTSTIEANVEARGFHLIEYLVWGINGNKAASALTARELEYLRAAAADLQNNTQILYDGWKVSGGNFARHFINAGTTGNQGYTSQKAALEEIINGLITIADEVATGKIQTPLDEGVSQEESRFSNNSKRDFADNMRSIKNIYWGDYNGNSRAGLTNIVAPKNSALDANIKSKIDAAISAIEAIPGTFTDAVTNNVPAVENARDKVAELQVLIQSQLKPFIANN
ncbi:imelysin family protein [Flavobacterium lindanitolerans]|uniref:imelysin family protein n=1 Tax=Flavobacterium lindanitolerans TaxID=428988 RepID=UPI0027BA89A3|nr:imelysin family protein [Flavobacterium lindanitolerans]MDQ7961560.1 imelysin family protein [Flavobacterium lindanitolerans]